MEIKIFKNSVLKTKTKQIYDEWFNSFEGDIITDVVSINSMLKHLHLKNTSDKIMY